MGNKISIYIKNLIANILYNSGYLNKKIRPCSFYILMFHRILPKEKIESYTQAGMYVTPSTFDMQMQYLCKNFNIVSINDVFKFILKKNLQLYSKPYCIITFDDGWKDNYIYAFPILKKYKVPATIFLSTNYINSSKEFWTDRLSRIIYYNKINEGNIFSSKIRIPLILELKKLNGSIENMIEKAISIFKNYTLEDIEKTLNVLTNILKIKNQGKLSHFLDWSEIEEMYNSGLITFGSHTANHQILTTISDVEIRKELEQSKNVLLEKKVVDINFIPFSYPNGDFDNNVIHLVKEIGYSLAVTTQSGFNDIDSDPFSLKRISIHEDISFTIPLFASRIFNIF